LAYINTDLLCYRASKPEELVLRQKNAWDPWVDWFEKKCEATLEITSDLKALVQLPVIHDSVRRDVDTMTMPQFTVFQSVSPMTGSVILALAFVAGSAEPQDLFNAMFVEELHKAEIYNEEKYGAAPDQEVRYISAKRDLKAARIFLELQNA
jgi:chaperone required for assembly of F1-ATPase